MQNPHFAFWQKSYQSNIEVDFYIPEDNLAIQVRYSIDDIDTKERELSAFVKLRNFMPNVKCLLITNSEETRTEYNGISIEVLPAWKWLLRN